MAPEGLLPQTSLRHFSNSLTRYKLELGLKRLGFTLPQEPVGLTFADLQQQLGLTGGSPAQSHSSVQAPEHSAIADQPEGDYASLRVGIDIECVASLSEVADPWEDEFYTSTFSPAEIARCLMQQNPRVHFAAAWCAKEALRKSKPEYMGLPLRATELFHDAEGAPSLRVSQKGSWKRIPCAVSISHTDDLAVAVLVWGVQGPRATPPARSASLPQFAANPAQAPIRSKASAASTFWVWTVALIALGLSIVSFLRKAG
jgi:phosphopantetheine--protein transferase-like protein